MLEQVVRQASRHVDLIEERLLSNHVQRNCDLAATADAFTLPAGCWRRSRRQMFRLLATGRRRGWIARWCRRFVSSTEEFSVVLNDLSGLIERISLLQEEIGARQLEQSNLHLYTPDGDHRPRAAD